MAKTINDVITETRVILQDTVTPYRYTTDQLIAYLNNGLYELKRLRPDAWVKTLDTDLPQFSNTATDLAAKFPLNMMFFTPMVMYMAGVAELRDDEFTMDSRAGILSTTLIGMTKVTGGPM